MPENNPIYNEKGRSTQIPQYDDIAFRNIEVSTLASVLENDYSFGASNQTLFTNLKQYHFHFGGLYRVTYLEVEGKLNKDDGEKVRTFLSNPIGTQLSRGMNDSNNVSILRSATKNALEVYDIYERALKAAGFRKTSYKAMSEDYKMIENR